MFDHTVSMRGNDVSIRFKEDGAWKTFTWNEVYSKVLDLIGALKKFGLKKGDRVCIFAKSCYEWTFTDLAIIGAGCVTVPIYESSLSDQAQYILDNCEAKAVFVGEATQLKKVKEVLSTLPHLKQIISFADVAKADKSDGIYTMDELFILGAGQGKETFDKMKDELTADSEVSYVYTSGTTGPPKGAVLTHGNFIGEVVALKKMLPFNPSMENLTFLPLAHIFARMVQFAQIDIGFVQSYAESIDKILDNLSEVRPHILASVPRIFEKIHTRVLQGVENGSDTKKKIFNWAVRVGEKRSHYLVRGLMVPVTLKLKWAVAYKLVFSKLHDKLGGRIQYFISGGAPLSKTIGEFFHAAGFLILEGYGLTETSAAVTVNTPDAMKIGTVGKIVPGVEVKIAPDGEILVRGGLVFKGYYKRPEETKEAIDADGWFHTGDIGIIDTEGFLKITDRKKDIIVTAAGKNVAPQNIENLFKSDPMISQVMIHGDNRKFLSALITLNKDQVEGYAKEHKIPFQDYADLVKNEKIYHLIKTRLDEKNRQLAKYETIKKFAILESDFSIETGELTPTLKVKRKFTSTKYKDILDSFYQD
ncbi:long-chain fatty acid--CoA ligase [bacterium]|nr:long-chain fatty acid--CoA ligase [bacterium]